MVDTNLPCCIDVEAIGRLEKSEVFVTRNHWTLRDPFEPPKELGWFGALDPFKDQ